MTRKTTAMRSMKDAATMRSLRTLIDYEVRSNGSAAGTVADFQFSTFD